MFLYRGGEGQSTPSVTLDLLPHGVTGSKRICPFTASTKNHRKLLVRPGTAQKHAGYGRHCRIYRRPYAHSYITGVQERSPKPQPQRKHKLQLR